MFTGRLGLFFEFITLLSRRVVLAANKGIVCSSLIISCLYPLHNEL